MDTVHPRLIAADQDIERIKQLIENNEEAGKMYTHLLQEAEEILKAPLVEYRVIGPRLLNESRKALDRIYTLGLIYRITREQRYLERAREELMSAAGFKDWNPSHFLDTAEMSHAFGIGYDWLYHDLSESDRTIIRDALLEKGINAYLAGWENGAWWTKATHNWNQVCHGGVGIGALAIADEFPDLANRVLEYAVTTMPQALKNYGPDGGWNEGPGYWHYATRYTVYFLAALNSALGTDFGLSEIEGLDRAGTFRIHFVGPSGETFNYADASSGNPSTHEMFWLAQRYQQPVYAWYQRTHNRNPHALDLIWFSENGSREDLQQLPLDAFYKGIDVVFFRSGWIDPNAMFLGFKAGDNKANHSHLDLGSFVLDAEGERWALDLGPDNYNLPGYFSQNQRWTYFRNNTLSHNTLILSRENQNPRAFAPVTQFATDQQQAFAVTDLTEAYQSQGARRIQRGVARIDDSAFIIRDEIKTDQPVSVRWAMLTRADVEYQQEQDKAILTQNGRVLELTILHPEQYTFKVLPADAPEPQRQNPGVNQIVIESPAETSEFSLVVQFSPQRKASMAKPEPWADRPLDQWSLQK